MSAPPALPAASPDQPVASAPPGSRRGRWKIGAAIFVVACLAQAALWTLWWEDPTHFKMSILFVWPAGLFALLIWWTFFSGWSSKTRYGAVISGAACIALFFSVFRFDRFNGDMVPTHVTYRWTPTASDRSRQFVEKLSVALPDADEGQPASPLVALAADWPGYRGPQRDGVVRDTTLRTDWSQRPPAEVWRHPVGKAWSSFAVVDDFVFTQEQRDDKEAVVAYRFRDGEQVWQHLDEATFSAADFQGGVGPRATPQFHEGKLYTLGATGILNCLDARTGKPIWTRNILTDAGTDGKPVANLVWGMSGSPLVIEQYVIVNPGGPRQNCVVAYDKETGKKLWSGGDHPASYASPSIATLHEKPVVLMPVGTGLAAYSLSSGKELWFFPWENDPKVNSALAVALPDNSVLFGIGYGVGTVRLNVELKDDNWSVTQRWHTNRFRPKFNDFVIRDGHIYGLDDGRLACLSLESGKQKWMSGRYGYGQILLIDDLLLILSEEGNVVLVPATPTKPEELGSFSALKDAITWNHPVLVRGKLLVRNAHEAACFDLE